MFERTTRATVVFTHPAHLPGVQQTLPPGTYVVETDEELIPGLSFVAYRRIRTSIIVPLVSGVHAGRQVDEIDPDDLAAAVARDLATSEFPIDSR